MTSSTQDRGSCPSCPRLKETVDLTGKQFHRFMDLPLSIRYMIYDLLLIRGKIFIRNSIAGGAYAVTPQNTTPPFSRLEEIPPVKTSAYYHTIIPYSRDTYRGHVRPRYTDWEAYAQPETGLLHGVSKAVQDEAERIFWSAKNLFVFPAGQFIVPSSYHSMHSSLLFSDPHSINFAAKAVSYTFDMRDAGPVCPYSAREYHRLHHGPDGPTAFDNLNPADQLRRQHDVLDQQLQAVWDDRCFLITRHLRLDRLQLDFGECYCVLGCCRKVEYVCAQLANCAGLAALCYRRPFRHGFPAVFEVIGFSDEAEKELIATRLADACRVSKHAFTFSHR